MLPLLVHGLFARFAVFAVFGLVALLLAVAAGVVSLGGLLGTWAALAT